jgi:hypothetical protein
MTRCQAGVASGQLDRVGGSRVKVGAAIAQGCGSADEPHPAGPHCCSPAAWRFAFRPDANPRSRWIEDRTGSGQRAPSALVGNLESGGIRSETKARNARRARSGAEIRLVGPCRPSRPEVLLPAFAIGRIGASDWPDRYWRLAGSVLPIGQLDTDEPGPARPVLAHFAGDRPASTARNAR